jgi:hypothetical protein
VQNGQTEKTIVEIAVRGVEAGEHDGMAFRSLYENLDVRNISHNAENRKRAMRLYHAWRAYNQFRTFVGHDHWVGVRSLSRTGN